MTSTFIEIVEEDTLVVVETDVAPPGSGGAVGVLVGDTSGPSNSNVVTGIQGVPVDSATPTFGELLVYDASTERYLKRLAAGGMIDVRDVPDADGNCAVFDGTTHCGPAVAAAWLWAHANKLDLRMPGGDALMLDADGNPVLIQLDHHVHPWGFAATGAGKLATALQYPALLGLVLDPTDLTLCGDPSGRVGQFAIDGLYQTKSTGAYHLRKFGVFGHHATQPGDAEDPERGWGVRLGGRAHLEEMVISNFHAGGVYRPRIGSAHPDKQIDHNTVEKSSIGEGCAHSYLWCYYSPVSGMNAGDGDHVIDNGDATQASVSSFTCDPAAVIFDSKIASIHKGSAPHSFLRQSGPTGPKVLPSAATVTRDSAGLVTVATLTVARPSLVWPGEHVGPAFGFRAGDVTELVGLGLALASDTNQIGRATAVTDAGAITFLMEHPITGSPTGPTDVTGQSIEHHYNNVRWLDSNTDFDGTDEGSATAFIRCIDGEGEVRGYTKASTLVHHGNEVIGRNTGNVQALSPVPVELVTRVNVTNAGHTAVAGDVMQVTVQLAPGTIVELDDTIFLNTPVSGPWKDDNPPQQGWNFDPDRCRGKWRVNSVADDGTHRLITFLQIAKATKLYTEKVLGDGTPSSAGGLGRVAGIVVGNWIAMSPTLDVQHENQSGSGPSEIEMAIGGQMRRSRISCTVESVKTVPNVRSLANTSDLDLLEPVRSKLVGGDLVAVVSHNAESTGGPTAGLVVPGHVMERTGREDVQLFRGGPFAGIALFRRSHGDYLPTMIEGSIRGSEYGIDFPADPDDEIHNHGGVLSRASFNQDDVLAGDPTDPGMARVAMGADVGTMRALGPSSTLRNVGDVTGVYITAVEILEWPVIPVGSGAIHGGTP